MTENGGSLWGGGSPWNGAYRDLDQKITNVAENFRMEVNTIRSEMQSGNAAIMAEIGRSAERTATAAAASAPKQTNPYQLIGTALTIVLALGSAGSWEAGNLNNAITANVAALKEEGDARLVTQRRIYDEIEKTAEKAWSKDAHLEFERRIDERNQLEQTYNHEIFAKLQSELVPRAENDQRWKDQTEDIGRLERQLSGSLDRLAEHVNKADDTNAQKFNEVDKGLHGFGLTDEVRDMQTQLRDISDKMFRLIAPNEDSKPKGPAD